jgi:hypothetical protein
MPTNSATAGRTYNFDLHAVHDHDRVETIVGLFGPQVMPDFDDEVFALDNEGSLYDARVESVQPDHSISLRLRLESKRALVETPAPISFGDYQAIFSGASH